MAQPAGTITGSELEVFDDVAFADLPQSDPNTIYGQQFLNSVDSLQVGGGKGARVMRVDKQGLWLGAETFADAPFSVDMDGNIVATSLTLATIGGTLDDIANGVTYNKTTVNAAIGAGYAYTGLNSSGEIIKGFLNSQLGSKSLPTNGVRVDSNGIYGRQSGSTTFYIDSAGNAFFSGTITAAAMSASTISGSTITGTTLTTANSGQRVVLTSTFAAYYNSSGTNIVNTLASSSSYIIQAQTSGGSIYLDHGTAGTIAFLRNGSIKLIFDGTSEYLAPFTNGHIDLGVSGANFKNVQHTGVHICQGIDQPIHYWGQVSGTTMSPDNTPGWSVSHPSTGKYTITHSLGHTNYACIANAIVGSGAGAYSAKIESFTSSVVRITIFDDGGIARDADFMFMLAEDPN
jgi:hypothetical protein